MQKSNPTTYIILLSTLLISCTKEMPKWDGKFWAASYEGQSLVRSQVPENISFNDTRINDYVCMSYKDLECLYMQLIDNCVQWRTLNPSCPTTSGEQAKALMPYAK